MYLVTINFISLFRCPESDNDTSDEHLFRFAFLSELQCISPGVQMGNILIDGLFSYTQMKLAERLGEKIPQGQDDVAILKLTQNSPSVLNHYWHPPSSTSEMPTYLAVGRSFIGYIHSQYGKKGIANMVKQLAHLDNETFGTISLTIKRSTLIELEAKWLTCLKYKVHSKSQISSSKFVWEITKLCFRSSGCCLIVALLCFLIDIGCYLYNAIAFGEVTEIASVAAQDLNVTHLSNLTVPASLLLGTVIIRCFAVLLSAASLSFVAVRASHVLRKKMIASIYCNPLEGSHDKVISAFSQNISQLEIGIGFAMINVIRGVVVSVTSIVVIAALAWPLGLPLAFSFLVVEVALSLLGKKLGHYTFCQEHATNVLSNVMREILAGHLENRVFGLLNFWSSRYAAMHNTLYKRKALKSLFVSQMILVLHFFIPLILTTGVLIGGFLLVIFGYTTFDRALTCFLLFASAASALRVSGSFLPALQTAKMALGRILAHCESVEHNPNQTTDDYSALIMINEIIKLNNVSFVYSPNSAFWQLHNINLSVTNGQRIAIVGPSGSGKSTLLKIIMGYYKPTKGAVFVDSCNMAQTNISSLPVSVVAQNSHFFHNMSVLDNLQLGNKLANYNTIKEATQAVGIHIWISSLPQGYDTIIGNDFSMSNGQRQRLALARALLKQPKILVLDEVTSALDPTSSKAVFHKIMEVSQGMTVVAVTHSLHQAKAFDQIVFVSHGVIKEVGSHRELMSIKGYYYRLWKKMAMPDDQPVLRESLHSVPRKLDTHHPSVHRQRSSLPNIHINCNYSTVKSPTTVPAQLDTLEEVDTHICSSLGATVNSSMATQSGMDALSTASKVNNCSKLPKLSKVSDKAVHGSTASIHNRPHPMQSSTPKIEVIQKPSLEGTSTRNLDLKYMGLTFAESPSMHTSSLTPGVPPVPPSTPYNNPQGTYCHSVLQALNSIPPVFVTRDAEEGEDPLGIGRQVVYSRGTDV